MITEIYACIFLGAKTGVTQYQTRLKTRLIDTIFKHAVIFAHLSLTCIFHYAYHAHFIDSLMNEHNECNNKHFMLNYRFLTTTSHALQWIIKGGAE